MKLNLETTGVFLHSLDTPGLGLDVKDKNFSFSIAGKAFYIVGLHPNSSRKARQSPYPTIAFNLYWQFEKLREIGTFNTVRDRIREKAVLDYMEI